MASPKWITPERQAELVELFAKSQGFCVYVNKPCQGEWERRSFVACAWGNVCANPVPDGKPCRYAPEQGKPHLPCNAIHLNKIRWHCAYGEYPCSKPHDCHYELYASRLIREWVQDDRAQAEEEWQEERKRLHDLGERRTPVRGQFNGIGRDIFHSRQPSYYLEGLGISGLTFKPFAKVKVANSFMRLHVNIGDALKAVSKSQRRKAIRYGKPLPKDVTGKVNELCSQAVRHYLNH
jgi:hypothetical protein